jgi:hypothetical protein
MPRQIDGKTYHTLDETARKVRVSTRTLKNYINKRIVSKPAEISQGLRTFFAFTDKWISAAREEIEKHRTMLR